MEKGSSTVLAVSAVSNRQYKNILVGLPTVKALVCLKPETWLK